MSTFARLQKQSQHFVQKMVEFSGLPYALVENVVQYARCLPKPGHLDIDENIFTAQMNQQFELTSPFMVHLIFNALKGERNTMVTLESFCKCICTFLCENKDMKINYVFKVYDVNRDGSLSYVEMYTFLKPCIMTHDEEEDPEDSLKELIEMVLSVTDTNDNGEIELEEFRGLVKSDILYIQLLGPCLPTDAAVKRFREKFEQKSPFEIRTEYELERYRSLNENPPKRESGYYPVALQMP